MFKISLARQPVCRIVVLSSVLAFFVIQGCQNLMVSGVSVVPVYDVDKHGISLDRARSLQQGDREDTIAAVFGEPADKQRSCVLNGIVWRYPIRAWNDMANRREIVPAIRLRARFDASSTLVDWGFIDARAEHALPVRETEDDAYRWFQSLSQAPSPIPPLIDLNETLIRGQTTQQEVERILGQWHPDIYCGNGGPVPVLTKMISESGSVWDWYVDRPSPLFVPPHYLVVSYDKQGALIGWHFEGTYPGGRK
jgi:hypothetical protein